jgi:hypothetical protein
MIMGGIASSSVVVLQGTLEIVDWVTNAEISVDAVRTVKSVINGKRMTIVEFCQLKKQEQKVSHSRCYRPSGLKGSLFLSRKSMIPL